MGVADKVGSVVLYIARHAEVQKDKEGKMRGLLNDPLDAKGEKQSQELAGLFEGKPLSAIYTDDLKRTKQTALPVAAAQGLEVQIDPELRSWDVGTELEGKSIEANKERIKELKSQPNKVPVAGQSWGDYIQQVRRYFNRYWEKALDATSPILLVIHGSGIQIVWDIIGERELSSAYDQTPLKPSGVAALYLTRSGPQVKILRGAKPSTDE